MPMRVVTFKAEDWLVEKMDLVARAQGISRSELIRRAIMRYIEATEPRVAESWTPKIIRVYG